jgi:hypothetical protein
MSNLQAYPPGGVVFTGIGILLSVSRSSRNSLFSGSYGDNITYQAVNAAIATQGVLFDLFERIENAFRRLEVYVEIPPTVGMTDAIVNVLVEILRILAIVTKEIKQNRARESIPGYG